VVHLGELVMILDLHRQGLSVSAIARQLGLDRKAVRKYIARGLEPPAYKPRPPRERRLNAFAGYLRERVAALILVWPPMPRQPPPADLGLRLT
jgi:transposase